MPCIEEKLTGESEKKTKSAPTQSKESKLAWMTMSKLHNVLLGTRPSNVPVIFKIVPA